MIDRNSPIPLYYQLKQHFKKQMESGELKAGDRLPTEMELCEQFDISRAPVRQALTELANEGLIYRRAGQGTFVAPQASANLEQKTHLKVLAHSDVRWMSSLEAAVRVWNQQQPGSEVQLDVTMCPRDDYHQLLRRAVAQGNAPDIVPLDFAWVTDYARNGYIVPLDTLDSLWVDALLQELEVPIVKSNTVNGMLHAVPVQADVTGMWYRKDWFEQEGLALPQTWDEWLDTLDYFAQPDVMQRLGHKHAVVLPVSSVAGEATMNLLVPFLWQAGGDVVGLNGELILDSPAVHNALHFLQSITIERRAYLPQDLASCRLWHLIRLFAQSEVPMTLGGTYEWPRIREHCDWADDEAATAQRMGFMLMPRPERSMLPLGSLGGTSWAILQQSSVQEEALEVLKLAATMNLSEVFCAENLQISPNRVVNAHLTQVGHPWLKQIVPLLPNARTRPLVGNYRQVSLFMRQMFEHILWEGTSVEQTVARTVQSLSLLLEGEL